jgi:hypothetical protein
VRKLRNLTVHYIDPASLMIQQFETESEILSGLTLDGTVLASKILRAS